MLMNNLDPDVAERPEELVVYGGIGRAARDWDSYDRIVESLTCLEDDQTLLNPVRQAGRGLSHACRRAARAYRQLQLVPHWATWEHFNELDRKGTLRCMAKMTAGSWIYIGSSRHRSGHL